MTISEYAGSQGGQVQEDLDDLIVETEEDTEAADVEDNSVFCFRRHAGKIKRKKALGHARLPQILHELL